MDGRSKRKSGHTAGSDGKSARKNIRIALVEGQLAATMASPAGPWRPLAKLNPPQTPIPSCVLLGKHYCKGLIMEQLEIIDLGDAMTETRCSQAVAPTFDAFTA
jgi:hypothetical protein